VPAQDRVRGDQQPQPVAAGFRYHAEQGSEQGPVRPVEPRAAQLLPSQDLSWWCRIKISAVCHVSSRRASRSHAASRVIRRNVNRRHMTGDHHRPSAGRATQLVRAVDAILGTHKQIVAQDPQLAEQPAAGFRRQAGVGKSFQHAPPVLKPADGGEHCLGGARSPTRGRRDVACEGLNTTPRLLSVSTTAPPAL
jgi:hypothetical protein